MSAFAEITTSEGATLGLRLLRDAPVPMFAQLREQLAMLIERGSMSAGTRLPTVRDLARALGVNPLTVSRAYRELSERGLVAGRRSEGTIVLERASTAADRASSVNGTPHPVLAERLYELSRAPGVISFTSNYPQVGTAVREAFRTALQRAQDTEWDSYFRYETSLGRPRLRDALAELLSQTGINAEPANIIVTSGGQQGLDLVARTVLRPGDAVIMERPTYYGAANAMIAAGARIIEIPVEADGPDIVRLEREIASPDVALIYLNPTFQNPTGITTSEEKRRRILAAARKFRIPVLEDDHASEMRFSGAAVPSLFALAEPEDEVFHVRGFGKSLLPGQRLGLVVTPPRRRDALVKAKATADLHGHGLIQEAFAHLLVEGRYASLMDGLRREYGERQAILFDALQRGLPDGVPVSRPEGGLSLWIGLPEQADLSELYFRAVRRGVAFLPGEAFFTSRPEHHFVRVSFGLVPRDQLAEGAERLCAVVRDLALGSTRSAFLI